MRRVSAPGATALGLFQNGSPSTGVPSTQLEEDWHNDVQEEILAPIEAAGLTPSSDRTQLLQAIQILSAQRGGQLNQAINGSMLIWQRWTVVPGITTSAVYTADRWRAVADGGGGPGAATVSRQSFLAGQAEVPGYPVYWLRYDQTTSATQAQPVLSQRIEGVREYDARQVTVSFWAYAQAPLGLTVIGRQNFGSGGSSEVDVVSQAYTLATGWTKYEFTFTAPSQAGKTIGAGSYFELEFRMPTGAVYQMNLAQVQVEFAAAGSAFERRSLVEELSLCERYYQQSMPSGNTAAQAGDSGSRQVYAGGSSSECRPLQLNFRTQMRTVPTVTWFAVSDGSVGTIDFGGAKRTVTGNVAEARTSTGYPTISGGPGGSSNAEAHFVADAEL